MKKLRPNLMVKDMKTSLAFYKDVFDAKIQSIIPIDGEPVWALLEIGEIQIMIEKPESLAEGISELTNIPIGASLTLYVDVENAESLYKKVKDHKADIVKEMHTTFYGTREFYMKDPNGYIFTFAESI